MTDSDHPGDPGGAASAGEAPPPDSVPRPAWVAAFGPDTPESPPPPPQHWFADVLAADGGVVRLRPITPDDAGILEQFHARLSDRTRYLRYFGPYPRMTPKDLYRTTHVDYRDRVGLVAELGAEIIAVGRYELLPDRAGPRAAEVAFVVADAHQGRGLGSILLEHLAGAAAENGIDTFVAEVLAENSAMVTVFRDAGYQVQRSRDGSVLHLEFAIDPTEALLSVRDSRERASEARSVGNLLHPRSVAVIGATPSAGRVGGAVLANLLSGVFQGPVFPVNPNRSSVRGVRAYATVRDIPDEVDLAVVAVPAAQIASVLDDCMTKGVKGLVVLTAGFSETGPAGFQAERDLVAAARGHGMRVVGPSALGIANTDPAVSLNATLASVLPGRGRVGFFCQSGPLGAAILGEAAARRLGLSAFVSAGNRADVSGNDLLQYWDTDADTDVVLLYLETFGNPRKFSRIARRVARTKPIVAVSSGRNALRTAPPTSLERSVERDLFAQAGIVQVDTISELFDCAMLLAYQPLPAGPRLAVIGNSAALAWLAVDAARGEGLKVSEPVDLGPQAGPEDFLTATAAAVASSAVDAVIVIFAPPVPTAVPAYAEAIRSGAGQGVHADGVDPAVAGVVKPVLTTFVADLGMPNLLATRGIGGAVAGACAPLRGLAHHPALGGAAPARSGYRPGAESDGAVDDSLVRGRLARRSGGGGAAGLLRHRGGRIPRGPRRGRGRGGGRGTRLSGGGQGHRGDVAQPLRSHRGAAGSVAALCGAARLRGPVGDLRQRGGAHPEDGNQGCRVRFARAGRPLVRIGDQLRALGHDHRPAR